MGGIFTMGKDYKEIAYNELLEDLKADLEVLMKEKEKLEIEYEKIKAEMTLYKKVMRGNDTFKNKYEDACRRKDNFSFNDIDTKIENVQALVYTLKNFIENGI
jgi:regulator of replication initiation timing